MSIARLRALTQKVDLLFGESNAVEMSIARLRALTHATCGFCPEVFMCRNEYRPIKGI